MNFLLISTMAFSLGYSTNDGVTSPGTFDAKSVEATTGRSGISNSSGITTDKMNTAPNKAPESDLEVIENSTLTSEEVYETGPYTREGTFNPSRPEEIQAQEENALDYSTTPKKRQSAPVKPDSKKQ